MLKFAKIMAISFYLNTLIFLFTGNSGWLWSLALAIALTVVVHLGK